MTAATPPDALAQAASPPSSATALSEIKREDLEKQKLQREIEKLGDELSFLNLVLRVANALIPVVVVLLSVLVGFFLNKRLTDLKAAEDWRREDAGWKKEGR